MEPLNLPFYEFRIEVRESGKFIFDHVRKKFVSLSPEEWVRQNFISYLTTDLSYPSSLIAVEKELKIDTLRRRPDLVVFNTKGRPVLIAEFKAPTVEIDEDALFQISLYNKKLNVPFIVLSNGLKHYCARIVTEENRLTFMTEMPHYSELSKLS